MNKNNIKELLKKLHGKNQESFLVLNPPREFLSVLWDIGHEINVQQRIVKNPASTADGKKISFALVFVRTVEEVEKYGLLLIGNLDENPVTWFAYPKKTSKTYKSELSRDHGWEILEKEGFGPVSLVAIDNDWSALRFKKRQ